MISRPVPRRDATAGCRVWHRSASYSCARHREAAQLRGAGSPYLAQLSSNRAVPYEPLDCASILKCCRRYTHARIAQLKADCGETAKTLLAAECLQCNMLQSYAHRGGLTRNMVAGIYLRRYTALLQSLQTKLLLHSESEPIMIKRPISAAKAIRTIPHSNSADHHHFTALLLADSSGKRCNGQLDQCVPS